MANTEIWHAPVNKGMAGKSWHFLKLRSNSIVEKQHEINRTNFSFHLLHLG